MKFGIIFEETYNNILSYKKHQHNGIVFYKRQLFFIGHKIGSFNFLLSIATIWPQMIINEKINKKEWSLAG